MITVILNCYKRPEYLREQIEAIRNQTVPVDDIWIWYNKPEDQDQLDLTELGCKVATCNHNFKFHGRFAFGLLAQTEYVAYFDDDTIPGPRWFESCLKEIEKENLILGSAGVLLQSNKYNPHRKIGWNGYRSPQLQYVDLVGHAWFMKRDTLQYMWREDQVSWDNGEDIQLSAFAYIHGNIRTAVPPHPSTDTSVWGSTKGNLYGNDSNASHKKTNHSPLRDMISSTVAQRGYVKVLDR